MRSYCGSLMPPRLGLPRTQQKAHFADRNTLPELPHPATR